MTGGEPGPDGTAVTGTEPQPCPHTADIPRTREAGWKQKDLTEERKSLTEGCTDTAEEFSHERRNKMEKRKAEGLGGVNILEVPGRDKQECS